jgi:hypothetical protein
MNIPTRAALQNKSSRYYYCDRRAALSKAFKPGTALLVFEEAGDGTYYIRFERTGKQLIQGFHQDITNAETDTAVKIKWEISLADDLLNLYTIKNSTTNEFLKCLSDEDLSGNPDANATYWSILDKTAVADVEMRVVLNATPCDPQRYEEILKASAPNGDKQFFDKLNEDSRKMGRLIEYAGNKDEQEWINIESKGGKKGKVIFYGDAHILILPQETLSPGCIAMCKEAKLNIDDYKTKVEYVVMYTVGRNTTVQTIFCVSALTVLSEVITSLLVKGFVKMFEQVMGKILTGLTESSLLAIEEAMQVQMAYMRCMSWIYSGGWLAAGLRCIVRLSVYAVIAYAVLYYLLPFLLKAYKYQLLLSNFSKKKVRIRIPYLDNVDNADKYKKEDLLLLPVSNVDKWITINDVPFKITDKLVNQAEIQFSNDNIFLEGLGELTRFNGIDEKEVESIDSVCLTTLIPRFGDNSINIAGSNGSTDFRKIYDDNKGKNKVKNLSKDVAGFRVELTMNPLSGATDNAYNSVCNIFDA